jgi:hypothetical protein
MDFRESFIVLPSRGKVYVCVPFYRVEGAIRKVPAVCCDFENSFERFDDQEAQDFREIVSEQPF